MRIFWLNGCLTIEPEGKNDLEALGVLYGIISNGVQVGRELPQTEAGTPRETTHEDTKHPSSV